ncbi:HYC_CC_PP family protein [Hymenobacter defluvii]|uniref:Bifunctional inhibitor/plant lipid transfer protein/seed storage helical domain-containing protein n=1 Tax=Hymenobacter defluvii TaxID=2054411 RepID=A0ABS3TEK4_9BACT|nr:hypothetical protein [Hymenobacter defluvii]MBO3272091.1 hypothetical protein [Hymenobacter defluvii]
MKRLTSLFLLFAYLLSSPGLVYSMHFCGQSLEGVSIKQQIPRSCCCQAMRAPARGCCHDQVVTSSVKDVKLTTSGVKVAAPAIAPAPALLPLVWHLSTFTLPLDEPESGLTAHAAPPPECPAYVRGHAFLI